MKIVLTIAATIVLYTGFSQVSKNCSPDSKEVYHPKIQQEKTIQELPQIENYKGDFQIVTNTNDKIALTTDFFGFIESSRKDHERVQIQMAGNRTLIIASRDELDASGKGPFQIAFLIQE